MPNRNLYLCQSHTTPALIRVDFYNRFFCEPKEVFEQSNMLWAGPVPDPLVADHETIKPKTDEDQAAPVVFAAEVQTQLELWS